MSDSTGMNDTKQRRPGDFILDRYMPDATPEEREGARENLRRLAKLLLRVHERPICENPQSTPRAMSLGDVNCKSRPV